MLTYPKVRAKMQRLKSTLSRWFAPKYPSLGFEKVSRADHVNAQQYANRALKNKQLLNSFDTLKNIRENRIRSQFNMWTNGESRHVLTPATRDALWSLIDVRSAADFRDHAGRAMAWLRNSVGDRPYALLVEIGADFGNFRPDTRRQFTKMKSSLWLAAPLVRVFGRPPAVVLPLLNGRVHPVLLKKALFQKNVKEFVHIDDTVYSGSQKADIVANFKAAIRGLRPRFPVSLYIGAAYSSPMGEEKVLNAAGANSKNVQVHFYKSHTLTRRELETHINQELRNKGINLRTAPLSTIMPHKVPNMISFAPREFGELLERIVKDPPYKQLKFS